MGKLHKVEHRALESSWESFRATGFVTGIAAVDVAPLASAAVAPAAELAGPRPSPTVCKDSESEAVLGAAALRFSARVGRLGSLTFKASSPACSCNALSCALASVLSILSAASSELSH